MRDIYFRGKRLDNGEWVVGNYYESSISGCYILKNEQKQTRNARTEQLTIKDKLAPFEVDPESVGQYTGVNDGMGQQIYEGDLITAMRGERNRAYYKIRYSENIAGFVAEAPGHRIVPAMNYGTMRSYRVAGNITDNPELFGETA